MIGQPICGLEDESLEEFVQNRSNFDEFVAENAARLPIMQTYPIKTDILQDWMLACIRSTDDPNVHAFARTFVANLQHVSFFQLRDRIYKVCLELRKRIEAAEEPLVVLLLGDGYRKSSTWIAMLAWHALRDVINLAAQRVDQLPASFWLAKTPIIIHADDMAYSGSQLTNRILDSRLTLKKYPRTQYLLLLPFIGRTAEERIADDVPFVKIPEAAERVRNFTQALEETGYNAGRVLATMARDPWGQLYGIEGGHALIYFDHKLADAVSIPNKMLAGPTVFNSATKEVEVFKIISNCEDAIYRNEKGHLLRWDTYVFDFATNFTCPVAFYKQIEYSWRDRKLTADGRHALLGLLE
jgi:hypothetical protein